MLFNLVEAQKIAFYSHLEGTASGSPPCWPFSSPVAQEGGFSEVPLSTQRQNLPKRNLIVFNLLTEIPVARET